MAIKELKKLPTGKTQTDSPGAGYWLGELTKPVEETGALSERERQGIYNLARRQQAGGYGAGLESLKSALGGRGFRVGESGAADTAVGQYITGQTESLAQKAGDIARQEAERRERLAGMNINRLMGAGGLEAQLAAVAAQRAAAKGQEALGRERLGWEKEQFGQTFPWEQEATRMGWLQNLMGMMGQSQQEVYAPWAQAMSQYE